ncbi:MAG: sulfurtransferase [Chromatiales bacterium]|jgi:thiosulfate/3-mercaptopyruvate sulfurtransferase
MPSFETLVGVDELAARLDDPSWCVVDCRFSLVDTDAAEQAYLQGHIPGARYAHMERDLSGELHDSSGRHPLPDPTELADTFGRWGIGPATQVVVYDDAGGAYAARLWWLLRWLGHAAVAVLDGGWNRWLEGQHPVATAVPPDETGGQFEPGEALEYWLASDSVLTALGRGEICLVDARAAERFRGEQEPIDPVAGHVPGAINRPYGENLIPDGRFKTPELLRSEFEQLLDGRPASQAVHMCGSGVTACHNLLAMQIAGLGGSSLYAGSWSEWIRDPSRPVAADPERSL